VRACARPGWAFVPLGLSRPAGCQAHGGLHVDRSIRSIVSVRSEHGSPSCTSRKRRTCSIGKLYKCFASFGRLLKWQQRRGLARPSSLKSCCPLSEASFLRSFFTTQTGEALSAKTFHHRHHAVVLSIPSTTPPCLAGPGRRSRWCAVRVQLSEAPPLAA
jgi:hypothetical protein